MNLIQEINQKQEELNTLQEEYNQQIQEEKTKVLTSKTIGMAKSLYLLGFTFESSCSRTAQYLEFFRVFSREFKNLLKPYIKEIQISKPNHFNVTGFFKLNNEQIYYFNIEDLRWNKEKMLIRTAEHLKDYTGGFNNFINLNESFKDNLFNYLKI